MALPASAAAFLELPERLQRHETGRRILVVDDDDRNARLMQSLLAPCGYEVARHGSGEEALAAIAAHVDAARKAPFDVLLLDVMMPGLSGFEVCRALRESEATRLSPIILVTALNSMEEKVRGLDAGADDFLSKPVNRVELLARVRSLLRVKCLQDEVESAREELERRNEELRAVQEHRRDLTQMIVHDFRAPLTGIIGHTEILRDRAAAGEQEVLRLSGRILRSSRQLEQMVSNVLDVSLLEEKRLPLRLELVDVAGLAERVVEDHRERATAAGISLEAGALPSCPGGSFEAEADESVVVRILGNLVGNALKHTPEGGRIRVGVERGAGESILVRVADTGEGIPPDARETIFEKCGRARGQRLGSSTDRGLGLTFCRMAAEAHGGRVWLEPNPEGGTTFTLALPA